ncbi:dihydroxy-acid dehydratase [Litchfieldella anticariensis FP35 = DSM 16096]|uniref:Dihydroxy-acid dehydratase n=1 Tax=Litchfieldella anticariensis (strain DSM 16096 / CECT 5854 / CIP 108499 / LMG 22089 / FP35) TaxID=1121939 RepID=S2L9S6_LITA3|nr:IlvD/Edd family dehydratase [Halomonas anticariensis]EPC01441.1 dihydroxy-acid dehydratase [Halomonas anticariensis FP35 = DSM 16096]
MSKNDTKQGMSTRLTNYGDEGFSLFLRKAFIKGMGYTDDALSRPVIGIANTYSGYNACHGNVDALVESVKRGVMLAGGLPIDFPTISLHESFSHPTSMYLRNLMALDTEEMIRAQPMDAVVLIGGCDKTVPAQLMAAASAGTPAIQLVTGPMLSGSHRGTRVGACTDCRRYWAAYRGQEIDDQEIAEVNDKLVPTVGTCSVMGTASTMACLAEALGMMLPGSATAPAVYADRRRIAEHTGAEAVRIAKEKIAPADIMTPAAFENALRVLLALGGSTNALIHLTAIAGRLGIDIDLQSFDRMSRETPVLVDLKPSGEHYMEHLHQAGGLAAVLHEIKPLLDLDVVTINGKTLGENLDATPRILNQQVVRPRDNPIYGQGGIAVLEGNLAPRGAIIKQSAASPALMDHTGRAVVFSCMEDLAKRIDDPDLDVNAEDILVLQNIGPKGAPGMPEAGYIPIPKKLAAQGVKDMVRISDGRMSGTAAGTIVLHVSPEAADQGPLALVRTGDRIRLDVGSRRLELLLDEDELARRRQSLTPVTPPQQGGGYRRLFLEQILQAEEGCDFRYCRLEPTIKVPRRG